MYILLALMATLLTSLLPILNKQLLRDARPAMVAWAINAASLPLLLGGTTLLTQCQLTSAWTPICTSRVPHVDGVFLGALLAAAALNWGAIMLSTRALAQADASLVSPLLTFNPAFTLLGAWLLLGERPGTRETIGVAVILLGAYLLDVETAQTGLLAPLRLLMRRPGTVLAILASALWGVTTVLEKLAIQHAVPPSGPLVALASTILTVLFLTPGALWPARSARRDGKTQSGRQQAAWGGLHVHPRAFLLAVLIAGIAPLFGFTAIALGLVGYVTALFKLSAVLTIVWARIVLGEGQVRERLLGALVMVAGGVLVAV